MEEVNVGEIQIGNEEQKVGAIEIPILKGEKGEPGKDGQPGQPGMPGEMGEPGVSVENVEQVQESEISNGINIIKVTLSDSQEFYFNVRNGEKGQDGGNYDDSELLVELSQKVDKEIGKSLISNSELERLSKINNYDDTELRQEIANKVSKETGKSLISDSELQRLSKITNYDDTAIKQMIADNLEVAKEYTDTEIANFDFVKVVNALPEVGLPNKVYFVPKEQAETNNIFEEYAWINGAWESFGTKIVEVDLTDVNASITELQKNKVDKETGKSLISDSEIERLANVENYDDAELREMINAKQDTLTAGENITIENGIISALGSGTAECEEGTWTPTFTCQSDSDTPTVTYKQQTGAYIKIPLKGTIYSFVYIHFYLKGIITAVKGNNYAAVGGLPFTPATSSTEGIAFTTFAKGVNTTHAIPTGIFVQGKINIKSATGGSRGAAEKWITDSGDCTIVGSGFYLTKQ